MSLCPPGLLYLFMTGFTGFCPATTEFLGTLLWRGRCAHARRCRFPWAVFLDLLPVGFDRNGHGGHLHGQATQTWQGVIFPNCRLLVESVRLDAGFCPIAKLHERHRESWRVKTSTLSFSGPEQDELDKPQVCRIGKRNVEIADLPALQKYIRVLDPAAQLFHVIPIALNCRKRTDSHAIPKKYIGNSGIPDGVVCW